MNHIIGLGTANDPQALKLETRGRRWVKNVLRPETPPALMRIRIEVTLQECSDARNVSESTIYNCYGLAFAARRSAIVDEEDVQAILDDDGYRRLPWDPSTWLPGDVVIYRKDSSEIAHVGLISRIVPDTATASFEVFVRSAWGDSGEYDHVIDHVPVLLGRPTEVVSQRFLAP